MSSRCGEFFCFTTTLYTLSFRFVFHFPKSDGERESEEGRKRAGSLSVFSAPWDSLLLLGA